VPEVTAGSATHAARATFDKSIEVVVGIFVPVGAAVAGFFMPNVLGGGNAVYRVLSGTVGATPSIGRASWAAQALINAAVGAAFWHMRNAGGLIMKAIGGAVGGFFLGGALGCLPGIFSARAASDGLIDHLVGAIQGVAAEG